MGVKIDKIVKAIFYRNMLKRPIDLVLAFLIILMISPILIILAVFVRIILGTPVIFKQKRPGLNSKLFTLYKFRTMTNEKDKNNIFLSDKQRLTNFGKMLRSSSLDELPEVFNILTGDMSFVGPRPQLVKDLVFMNDKQIKRQSIRPGLTGLAQINGRNAISWEEKFRFDLEYVDNYSLACDFRILIKTFIKVIKRVGISQEGMETAEDYGDYLLREKKISLREYETKIDRCKKLTGE